MSAGFVVLSDAPGAAPRTPDAYPFPAARVLAHPSGRPWVVGGWDPDEVRRTTAGPVRLVVIGHCPVTTDRLERLARGLRTLADVDAVARELPGSFHLVAATDDGATRVQGGLTGLRQVFHARLVDGTPLAADRADVLAALTGAGVDEDVLAVRVACGGMLPPPLADRSPWAGVATVPHDHCLVLEADRAREVLRWRPPDPELPLDDGAVALRQALVTAVDARRPDGTSAPGPSAGSLSSDLSGGMDSTSLAFLAARHTPDLLAFRWAEAEAGNDDARYAAHAAARLPDAHHLVLPQEELPPVFADPEALADTERPYLYARTHARMRHTARVLAAHGSRHHLAGHGADELLGRTYGYLHRLVRRHPLTGLRHLRGNRALGRWPLAATLGQLARADTPSDWWRAQAAALTGPPPPARLPSLSWGLAPLRAPAWASDAAVDAARAALLEAADSARPFAEDRGQHQCLTALRVTSPAYRQVARLFAAEGVRLHLPFLDDRVVEAALAVRLDQRVTPWRYKPLLARSLRGLVPDLVLDRTTKGDFSADLRTGRRRNLGALLDVFADSELARLGVIDADAVRARLLAPQADSARDIAVEQLLGCETWARAARRPLPLRT
ncbi:asparagine synthase [Streptomyces longispororuber]|uniref:asparagine synthase (glutamine-hydrolyzing) n=1 Tax=Streptomyces longispororuber TaxID=68230 RepID=A0A918Z5Z7_9ACTN|nr:asparagine synthase-related protein [Streptomyces longispororuber]GHE38197.1 asparagine synthase [Streptomyces longispororuber]